MSRFRRLISLLLLLVAAAAAQETVRSLSLLHVGDLHAGLWANAMTGTAGAPFFWWFDYIDRYDLYGEFRRLSMFMAGEDRRARELQTVEPEVVTPFENDFRNSIQLKRSTEKLGTPNVEGGRIRVADLKLGSA